MRELFEFFFERPELRKLTKELHDTVLFHALSSTELDRVIAHAQLRSFTKGDHIFFEGDPGSALYIILKGNIRILRHVRGKHVVLAELGKGMFFGELALVSGMPRTATALVAEDALVVCLFRHDLERLIKHHPKLGNKLLLSVSQILAKRLATTLERSTDNKHK